MYIGFVMILLNVSSKYFEIVFIFHEANATIKKYEGSENRTIISKENLAPNEISRSHGRTNERNCFMENSIGAVVLKQISDDLRANIYFSR